MSGIRIRPARSTLVLVHRKPLLERWVERLDEFLDLEPDGIGMIGGGRGKPNGKVDVAMVQSVARHKTLDQLLARYGHIVVDECHHVPAVMTERVLQAAPARYVMGLTATPKRRDGHHPIIAMQCGPVRHTIGHRAAISSRPLVLRVVRRDTHFDQQTLPTDPHIEEVFTALATDEARTELIATDTLELAAQGRHPIVLTERREHLERLAEHLTRGSHTLIALHGGMRPAELRAAKAQLAGSEGDGRRVVLATGRYVGEGFDDPASTRCCSRCQSHGKAPSSSTRDVFTVPTPGSKMSSSTTTSTPSCPCCGACSPSAYGLTGHSGTNSPRPCNAPLGSLEPGRTSPMVWCDLTTVSCSAEGAVPSVEGAMIFFMLRHDDGALAKLKVPAELRPRVSEILAVTDEVCSAHLDDEYGELCRVLLGRLARKRPSPLARGDTRIWAAGVIYAVGRVNFLFDRSQRPHLSADQLARYAGVVKTTMANKAALITKALGLSIFEPDLTRLATLEEHPLTWMVMVDGFIVDARTLPPDIQDEARRRGVIPDLETRRAA